MAEARNITNSDEEEVLLASADAPSRKTLLPRSVTKDNRSAVARACAWVVQNQLAISATLVSLLTTTHCWSPTTRHHTNKFFHISYYNAKTGRYALGWDDISFVFFWIIVFSGMRCAVMDYVLSPLGAALGLRKKKLTVRFAEQAWIVVYYTASSLVGLSIVYHSDYWMNLEALWQDWPVREMDGFNKWYYLVQFAFYLTQTIVVNIEERRKDHWQMFSHHVITCTLIFASYGYHFTKVGTLILVLMDVVDVFLPLAKVLRYLKFQLACDITFAVFMVVWLITRHILYGMTWWSAYAAVDTHIKHGCYYGSYGDLRGPYPVPNDWAHVTEPFRNPVGQICFNTSVKWTFLSLLLSLQCLLLIWFYMIVRVAYKVISGSGAEDVRSDDEDDEEEDEEEEDEEEKTDRDVNLIEQGKKLHRGDGLYIEKEVDSTQLTFTNTHRGNGRSMKSTSQSPVRRPSRRRADGNSTGVNILGPSSDRKELLGRIGCDKSSDE